MISSHLFVVLGNITHLACDAWMLPTDMRVEVSAWADQVHDLDERVRSTPTDDLRDGRAVAVALETPTGEPVPILTRVPEFGFDRAEQLEPAIREFVAEAARVSRARRDRQSSGGSNSNSNGTGKASDPILPANRTVPLVALPFFGTLGGGGTVRRGDVMQTILRTAAEAAEQEGVDVALVLRDEKAFAFAQHFRRTVRNPTLDVAEAARPELERLAALAKDELLVPFMGAGVSVSAGAPSWSDLIDRLARRVDLPDAARESLAKRSVLDQAAFLRQAFEHQFGRAADSADDVFAQAVADIVRIRRHGLAPALLATLRAEQAITLNYDELFERAADDAHLPRTIIGGSSRVEGPRSERWLLKLHGTVTDPASIVLTRDDYLGYETDRAALSALVKATLMTRHLLFVGFGLQDDHFHEIVHDVRRATLGQVGPDGLGTVLTLTDDPLDRALWRGDLRFVPFAGSDDIAANARDLEIFLDALAALSSDSHSYLLTDGFEDGLTAEELRLREELLGFAATAERGGVSGAAAWPAVARLLRELGAP